jgi:hypothetical protein
VWPAFRLEDRVRVIAMDRFGYVNQIEPDADGERWIFEILFDERSQGVLDRRPETAKHRDDELELIERSGLEHEPELELDIETSGDNPAAAAADVLRIATTAFRVAAAGFDITDKRVRVQLSPRDHPRLAAQSLMARLGPSWLTEDDGWYANVTWIGEQVPPRRR